MPVPAVLSLADGLKQGHDNFLLLRLIAALLVLLGHSYAVAQIPGLHDFIGRAGWGQGIYTGSIAVDIFFVVSGFLVAGSYINRRDLRFFIRSRILRIVPGYLVCVFACAYLIGPWITTLPLGEYLKHPDTLFYVLRNMTFYSMQWTLPGVFESNPHPQVVNGSLWTLPAEVMMYVLLAGIGLIGLLHRRNGFNLGFLLICGLAAWFPAEAATLLPADGYARLAALFALGVFFQVNREFIPVSGYLASALVLLAYLLHGTPRFGVIFGLAIGYCSLWFAYGLRLKGFERWGDYSYGVYLWGFPIQQLLALGIERPAPMLVFVLAVPITLLVAVASWHWIEKPALSLKHSPIHLWPARILGLGHRPVPAASP
jgi:peptidoglycan/LPS O-acetylase OafA/YrhL